MLRKGPLTPAATSLCVSAVLISGCSTSEPESRSAGRWAGNQTWSTSGVDALGASAYEDGVNGEIITRCHRSKGAATHIGSVKSLNLACSGAITSTEFDAAGNGSSRSVPPMKARQVASGLDAATRHSEIAR